MSLTIDGINLFYSAGVMCSDNGTVNTSRPLGRVVDGNLDTTVYAEVTSDDSNPVYIDIVLGESVLISEITVFHYYSDGRTYYGTKTEISADGINWTTIFDSGVSGTYAETSSGKTHVFTEQNVKYVRDWLNGSATNAANHWVEVQSIGSVALLTPDLKLTTPTWANKETVEQANSYPDTVQTLEHNHNTGIVGKFGNYSSLLDQRGERRKDGYYQSTTTVSGVPVAGVRVLCFTNDGQLRDEVRSDAQGNYRFDHLLMDEKYMFVAQYDEGDSRTQPVYLAVAADWQTPTAY